MIGNKELIRWSYDSCRAAQEVLSKKNLSSQVKILCPNLDTELIQFCETNLLGYAAPLCDEEDLIKRYLLAATESEADAVIRVTADCWQTNPGLVVEIAEMLIKDGADYASNTIHRSFMEGTDIQGCSMKALKWFDENQLERREHPFVEFDENKIIRDRFEKEGMKFAELINPRAEWCIRTSIDTPEDLELARNLYSKYQEKKASLKDSPPLIESARA